MSWLKKIVDFLLTKKSEEKNVSDISAINAVEAPVATTADVATDSADVVSPVATEAAATPAIAKSVSDVDAILDKVKTLLVAAGHDVEEIWEHIEAIAKKTL